MYFPVVFLSGLLSAVSVSSTFLDAREVSARGIIQARQISSTSCETTCGTFEDSLNSCDASTSSCICTTAIEASLQACVNCAVAANFTQAVIATAQNLTSLYDLACSSSNLASPTVPTSLPTSSSAGSNSASGSSATTSLGSVFASGSSSATTSVLAVPSQITIRPSSTTSGVTTSATAATTGLTGSAAKMEAAKALAVVGIGAAIALGLF